MFHILALSSFTIPTDRRWSLEEARELNETTTIQAHGIDTANDANVPTIRLVNVFSVTRVICDS